MNVNVYINGNSVKHHLVSYEREHKICTGIGVFTMELDADHSGNIDTWDEVSLYEGGKHVGTYFVCQVGRSQPTSTIRVEAQDHSKYLVDYYISEQYFIDYPTTTRYWIEEFLKQAGIKKVKFLPNASQPILLSNNTTLGMMSAYDQIMYLLQISGWYMHFDRNGTCIIGKLSTEMSKNRGRFGKRDIVEMSVVEHDKMLRNRVVVWGRGNDRMGTTVHAEASTITPWNYDKKDYRSMVISNSNIPSSGVASSLAYKALSEFEKLTVEKHATLVGARNLEVGDVISLRAGFTSGRGLITTFGTTMSSDGLYTKVILDERCPRLFAYFDLGDYVYIGTVSSGIWRRHLKWNWYNSSGIEPSGLAPSGIWYSGWQDFSSGLESLAIADLHISNGSMGCVTEDGGCYVRTVDDDYWTRVPISGLFILGSGNSHITYSGDVKGRAVIVDREDGNVKFAVDTGPWNTPLFYEDLLTGLMTNSLITSFSGVQGSVPCVDFLTSGLSISGADSMIDGTRAWIVETDPYSASILGSYPVVITSGITFSGYVFSGVSISGMMVLDIEEGGDYDYLSVRVGGSGLESLPYYDGYGWGWCNHWHRSRSSITVVNPNVAEREYIPTSFYNVGKNAVIFDERFDKEISFLYTKNYGQSAQHAELMVRRFYIDDSGVLVQHSEKSIDLSSEISDARHYYLYRVSPGVYRIYGSTKVVTVDYETESLYSVPNEFSELSEEYLPDLDTFFYENKVYYARVVRPSDDLLEIKMYTVDLHNLTFSSKTWFSVVDRHSEMENVLPDFGDNLSSYVHLYMKDGGVYCRYITPVVTQITPPDSDGWKHVYLKTIQVDGLADGHGYFKDIFPQYYYGKFLPETAFYHTYEYYHFKAHHDYSDDDYVVIYKRRSEGNDSHYIISYDTVTKRGYYPGGQANYYYDFPYGHSFSDIYFDLLYKIPLRIYGINFPYFLRYNYANKKFTLLDKRTLDTVAEYQIDCGWLLASRPYPRAVADGYILANAYNYIEDYDTVIGFDPLSGHVVYDSKVRASQYTLGVTYNDLRGYYGTNVGNFLVTFLKQLYSNPSLETWFYRLRYLTLPSFKPNYLVLQGKKSLQLENSVQDGPVYVNSSGNMTEQFSIIYTGVYPHRLDISKYSPLVVADYRESSLAMIYADASGITIMQQNPSGLSTDRQIFDFCYTDLAISGAVLSGISESQIPTESGIVYSGSGDVSRKLLYTVSSGLYLKDAFDVGVSGLMWLSLSGTRMTEATNYAFDGQYVFTSVSGYFASKDIPSGIMVGGTVVSGVFFQKDPDFAYFLDASSGIPPSEITIIRVDEVI